MNVSDSCVHLSASCEHLCASFWHWAYKVSAFESHVVLDWPISRDVYNIRPCCLVAGMHTPQPKTAKHDLNNCESRNIGACDVTCMRTNFIHHRVSVKRDFLPNYVEVNI